MVLKLEVWEGEGSPGFFAWLCLRVVGMGSYKMCWCFTRKFQWKEAEPPQDVKEAFSVYAEGGAYMNAEQLYRFLADAQGEDDATVARAEALIDRFQQLRYRRLARLSKPLLSLEDFHHFLFTDELNPPIRSKASAFGHLPSPPSVSA